MKGAIYREKNPRDGRGVLIKLTDYGKEKREKAKEVVIRFNKLIKSEVTDSQLKNFFEVMDTINKLIGENAFFEKKRLKYKHKK